MTADLIILAGDLTDWLNLFFVAIAIAVALYVFSTERIRRRNVKATAKHLQDLIISFKEKMS